MLSPPLDMSPRWFAGHTAYSMAKYGMSLCVLGMAAEFRAEGIGINALWPRTVIATAAVAMIPGASERVDMMRRPAILADAAHVILTRDARSTTGNFFIDEAVLAQVGLKDFSRYAIKPGAPLLPDLSLD
jgi:citronellol/citronellal dehydrogenase